MYFSVDAALSDVYRFGALRIEPQNNTGKICAWVESRGVVNRGNGELTQHEWHANAVMIQSRIERILPDIERMAIECQYGKVDLYNIIDLTRYITDRNPKINILSCDTILAHLFTERPQVNQIADKFDMSRSTVWREKNKVSKEIAALINSAICKLEPEFIKCGIVRLAG